MKHFWKNIDFPSYLWTYRLSLFFYINKNAVNQRLTKRLSFTSQYVTYYKTKGHLLERKMPLLQILSFHAVAIS